MTNTFNVQNIVAAEALAILSNELVISKKITRQYEDKFDLNIEDHRVGTSITIQKPPKFMVRHGSTRSAQDIVESTVTLSIDTYSGVDTDFTDTELALLTPDPEKNMPEWSKRFLQPKMTRIINDIDADIFARAYVLVPNLVGTPGVTPQTVDVLGDAMEKLDNNLAPQDDRTVILNQKARNKLSMSLRGLFLEKMASDALQKGKIGDTGMFEVYMSQLVPNQTVGALGGTPTVSSTAGQVGSTLTTSGWSNNITGVLAKGDIITIGSGTTGVYMVNPITKTKGTDLQQFVVTAAANSDGSGNSTISIYPSIITSGATQTVNASPPANAAITVTGTASTTYAQNLGFHKDAFTMAFGKLITPKGVDMAATKSADGFSMRYVRAWNNTLGRLEDRLEAFYGFAGLYPEWGCRITS